MSALPLDDLRAAGPVERLLEDSWSSRAEGPGRRELLVETLAGLLFLACAVPLGAFALAHHGVDPLLLSASWSSMRSARA